MDTKLHEAVRYGDKEGVLEALRQGFDPNELGLLRWSPVQEAARVGEREILFHLLQHGGDANLPDGLCNRNTALHFAAMEGHEDCVRVLLQHGADAHVVNAEGQTCLQVTPLECRDALARLIRQFSARCRRHKLTQDKGTTSHQPGSVNHQPDTVNHSGSVNHQPDTVNHSGSVNHQPGFVNNQPGSMNCQPGFVNHQSGSMNHQPSPPQANKWDTLPQLPPAAGMGYLHLSFEYHKEVFKVRVWQISDLLLPPPQLSMIHSIFVRAYFIPDKKHKTQRRTEDVVLDMPELIGVEAPKTGIQHIFTPSSFKFRIPLLYRTVTEAMVKEHSLQIEVCMTQKRTHRTFLMAMIHLPLSIAVRRPIREKYALIPCMNITIPNNMRVYSAAQLQLESSKGSNSPSIRRVMAHEQVAAVTAQEVDLEDVVSLSGEDFLRSHLILCLDDSDSDENLHDDDGLREVRVINSVGSAASSSSTLNVPSSGDDIDNDDCIPTVMTHKQGPRNRSTVVDMSGADSAEIPAVKKKIIPNELLKAIGDEAVHLPSEDVVVDMDVPSPAAVSSHVSQADSDSVAHKRRKIKPVGLGRDSMRDNANTGVAEQHCEVQVGVSSMHNSSPAVRRKKIMLLPGQISIPSGERAEASKSSPSCQSQNSSTSSDEQSPGRKATHLSHLQDMAFSSPASRPETPCWDFYDWNEDLQTEEALEVSRGALDESLSHLRQQGMGSLLNLSKEPILPMDLADDFDTLHIDSETVDKQE